MTRYIKCQYLRSPKKFDSSHPLAFLWFSSFTEPSSVSTVVADDASNVISKN